MPEEMKLSEIHINPNNPRLIKDARFKKLVKSISEFPKMMELRPIIIDSEGLILGGNMRFKALKELKYKDVPDVWVKRADELTDEEKQRFIIEDNIGFGEFDWEMLNDWDKDQLIDWGVEFTDFDLQTSEDKKEIAIQKLSERFIINPVSILDTRQGIWQDRKKYWKELINDNGESRKNTLRKSKSSTPQYYHHKNIIERKLGEKISNTEFEDYYFDDIYKNSNKGILSGSSILDPVLSELVNLWFGLPNCKAFDCFAGDSVFGYVSSYLGNSFTGIELRKEQTDLNNERIKGFNSKYICDDGQNVSNHIAENTQDLLFSCPPYFNLEVYSDLQNDASNQKEYKDFLSILENAFSRSIKCLKNNRFAVITVGDIRDKNGFYYRLIDDIKDIFKRNDVLLYNELILIEVIGNLAMRVNKLMENRKIGKCHQNILVFYKGDPKQIKNMFPRIEIPEINESTDLAL